MLTILKCQPLDRCKIKIAERFNGSFSFFGPFWVHLAYKISNKPVTKVNRILIKR
jgi:hypothetical protein